MPQKRVRITRGQAKRIRQLDRELDDYTLRTLLTGTNQRLMRPERLANLKAGRGKLQPWERERITLVQRNAGSLSRLKEINEEKGVLYSARKKPLSGGYAERLRNKALRTWVIRGKEKDMPYDMQPRKQQIQQHKAIKALYFLGVEPDQGKAYTYVRKD